MKPNVLWCLALVSFLNQVRFIIFIWRCTGSCMSETLCSLNCLCVRKCSWLPTSSSLPPTGSRVFPLWIKWFMLDAAACCICIKCLSQTVYINIQFTNDTTCKSKAAFLCFLYPDTIICKTLKKMISKVLIIKQEISNFWFFYFLLSNLK